MILYAPCDREQVDRISISIVRDNLGGGDDDLLWEIRTISKPVDFEVIEAVPGGQPPAGFRTTVPLDVPLPPSHLLTAAMFPSTGSANASTFELSELRRGKILTDTDEYIDRSDFVSLARDTCDNQVES